MKLSGISRKLSSVIAGGLIALILPLSNCKLSERTRTIEPVAWADVNRDGVKDAIIKKIKIVDPYKTKYDETLVAIDGRNIKKEGERLVTNDSYNILIGAFGSFEIVEGRMIIPEKQKWGYGSYVPLHARMLASKDGKFDNISFEDNGLRISADVSTTSSHGPSMPNRYRLSGIRSLGFKMNSLGHIKRLK
jgi:hypothetical protein